MRGTIFTMLLVLAATACAPLVVGQDAPASSAPEEPLQQTLDRHLAAINARDIEQLLATVTSGPKLTTILPNGNVLETRDQYRQLHVDWFAANDWRMVFDVQDVTEFGDLGIARVKYDSQKLDAAGEYRSNRVALLTLVFAKEAGEWRLVYDQNTVIPAATS